MKEDKMSENKSRREFISQSGKMVTACALFGATGSVAYAADPRSQPARRANR
jgi:hypothetical protein